MLILVHFGCLFQCRNDVFCFEGEPALPVVDGRPPECDPELHRRGPGVSGPQRALQQLQAAAQQVHHGRQVRVDILYPVVLVFLYSWDHSRFEGERKNRERLRTGWRDVYLGI